MGRRSAGGPGGEEAVSGECCRGIRGWTFTAYTTHAGLLGLLAHCELILPGVMSAGHWGWGGGESGRRVGAVRGGR